MLRWRVVLPGVGFAIRRDVFLWLLTACCFAGSLSAEAKPKPQQELNELRERIERLQNELAAKEESRSEAADALKESELLISEAGRRLHELDEKSRVAQAEVAGAERRRRLLEERIADEKARVDKMLRNRYLHGGQDALKMILGGQDPALVARQLHYFSHISRARLALVGQIRKDVESLADLKAEAQQKAEQLDRLQAEEAAGKRQLEAEQAKRRQMLAQLSTQLAKQRKEIGRLKENEQRLTRLVEELNRLLAKKRAEEARKRADAEAKAAKKPIPTERNDAIADESLAGQLFASLKGRLKLPVRGELARRFGSPREAGGPSWKGLFIRAETGQMVRAVADGDVVYADWLRGFGNLLILDHGGGYMSLYGYNAALLKAVGDTIVSGENIAQIGNTGGVADSGLYFELRYQSKPFDPLDWVAK